MKVRVHVKLKEGVLDPQGKAVNHALHAMGYEDVQDVRIGKLIELEINGEGDYQAQILEMCDKLLANPVIEDYEVVT